MDQQDNMMWIGYCAFHVGDYQKAQQTYLDILKVGHDSHLEAIIKTYAKEPHRKRRDTTDIARIC